MSFKDPDAALVHSLDSHLRRAISTNPIGIAVAEANFAERPRRAVTWEPTTRLLIPAGAVVDPISAVVGAGAEVALSASVRRSFS